MFSLQNAYVPKILNPRNRQNRRIHPQADLAARKPISKHGLLKPYFENDFSAIQSKRMADDFKRCITETKKAKKDTPEFIEEVLNKILYLHNFNLKVSEVTFKYPLTKNFKQLLLHYIRLQCNIRREYCTPRYVIVVEERLMRLLLTVYNSCFEIIPNITPKKVSDESATAVIKLLIEFKTQFDIDSILVENIAVKLLRKLGKWEKVRALMEKYCQLDTYLPYPTILDTCKDILISDYGEEEVLKFQDDRIEVLLEDDNNDSDNVDVDIKPEIDTGLGQSNTEQPNERSKMQSIEIYDDEYLMMSWRNKETKTSNISPERSVKDEEKQPVQEEKQSKPFTHRPMVLNLSEIKGNVKEEVDDFALSSEDDATGVPKCSDPRGSCSFLNDIIVTDDISKPVLPVDHKLAIISVGSKPTLPTNSQHLISNTSLPPINVSVEEDSRLTIVDETVKETHLLPSEIVNNKNSDAKESKTGNYYEAKEESKMPPEDETLKTTGRPECSSLLNDIVVINDDCDDVSRPALPLGEKLAISSVGSEPNLPTNSQQLVANTLSCLSPINALVERDSKLANETVNEICFLSETEDDDTKDKSSDAKGYEAKGELKISSERTSPISVKSNLVESELSEENVELDNFESYYVIEARKSRTPAVCELQNQMVQVQNKMESTLQASNNNKLALHQEINIENSLSKDSKSISDVEDRIQTESNITKHIMEEQNRDNGLTEINIVEEIETSKGNEDVQVIQKRSIEFEEQTYDNALSLDSIKYQEIENENRFYTGDKVTLEINQYVHEMGTFQEVSGNKETEKSNEIEQTSTEQLENGPKVVTNVDHFVHQVMNPNPNQEIIAAKVMTLSESMEDMAQDLEPSVDKDLIVNEEKSFESNEATEEISSVEKLTDKPMLNAKFMEVSNVENKNDSRSKEIIENIVEDINIEKVEEEKIIHMEMPYEETTEQKVDKEVEVYADKDISSTNIEDTKCDILHGKDSVKQYNLKEAFISLEKLPENKQLRRISTNSEDFDKNIDILKKPVDEIEAAQTQLHEETEFIVEKMSSNAPTKITEEEKYIVENNEEVKDKNTQNVDTYEKQIFENTKICTDVCENLNNYIRPSDVPTLEDIGKPIAQNSVASPVSKSQFHEEIDNIQLEENNEHSKKHNTKGSENCVESSQKMEIHPTLSETLPRNLEVFAVQNTAVNIEKCIVEERVIELVNEEEGKNVTVNSDKNTENVNSIQEAAILKGGENFKNSVADIDVHKGMEELNKTSTPEISDEAIELGNEEEGKNVTENSDNNTESINSMQEAAILNEEEIFKNSIADTGVDKGMEELNKTSTPEISDEAIELVNEEEGKTITENSDNNTESINSIQEAAILNEEEIFKNSIADTGVDKGMEELNKTSTPEISDEAIELGNEEEGKNVTENSDNNTESINSMQEAAILNEEEIFKNFIADTGVDKGMEELNKTSTPEISDEAIELVNEEEGKTITENSDNNTESINSIQEAAILNEEEIFKNFIADTGVDKGMEELNKTSTPEISDEAIELVNEEEGKNITENSDNNTESINSIQEAAILNEEEIFKNSIADTDVDKGMEELNTTSTSHTPEITDEVFLYKEQSLTEDVTLIVKNCATDQFIDEEQGEKITDKSSQDDCTESVTVDGSLQRATLTKTLEIEENIVTVEISQEPDILSNGEETCEEPLNDINSTPGQHPEEFEEQSAKLSETLVNEINQKDKFNKNKTLELHAETINKHILQNITVGAESVMEKKDIETLIEEEGGNITEKSVQDNIERVTVDQSPETATLKENIPREIVEMVDSEQDSDILKDEKVEEIEEKSLDTFEKPVDNINLPLEDISASANSNENKVASEFLSRDMTDKSVEDNLSCDTKNTIVGDTFIESIIEQNVIKITENIESIVIDQCPREVALIEAVKITPDGNMEDVDKLYEAEILKGEVCEEFAENEDASVKSEMKETKRKLSDSLEKINLSQDEKPVKIADIKSRSNEGDICKVGQVLLQNEDPLKTLSDLNVVDNFSQEIISNENPNICAIMCKSSSNEDERLDGNDPNTADFTSHEEFHDHIKETEFINDLNIQKEELVTETNILAPNVSEPMIIEGTVNHDIPKFDNDKNVNVNYIPESEKSNSNITSQNVPTEVALDGSDSILEKMKDALKKIGTEIVIATNDKKVESEKIVQDLEICAIPNENTLLDLLATVASEVPRQDLLTPKRKKKGARRGRRRQSIYKHKGTARMSKQPAKIVTDFEQKCKPHDFVIISNSVVPPPANNIYTQKLPDVSITSEDSNDSEGNLLIDEDVDLKSSKHPKDIIEEIRITETDMIQTEKLSPYDEDTFEEKITFACESKVKGTVQISIPDNYRANFDILKQIEEMELCSSNKSGDVIHEQGGNKIDHENVSNNTNSFIKKDFSSTDEITNQEYSGKPEENLLNEVAANVDIDKEISNSTQDQLSSENKHLGVIHYKPFRTMAERKDYDKFKLNPYVSIERLNVCCKVKEEEKCIRTRSKSFDISMIRNSERTYSDVRCEQKEYLNETSSNITPNSDPKEKIDIEENVSNVSDTSRNLVEIKSTLPQITVKSPIPCLNDDNLPLAKLKENLEMECHAREEMHDSVPLVVRKKSKTKGRRKRTSAKRKKGKVVRRKVEKCQTKDKINKSITHEKSTNEIVEANDSTIITTRLRRRSSLDKAEDVICSHTSNDKVLPETDSKPKTKSGSKGSSSEITSDVSLEQKDSPILNFEIEQKQTNLINIEDESMVFNKTPIKPEKNFNVNEGDIVGNSNRKYYTTPKLRRKSISRDNLNRIERNSVVPEDNLNSNALKDEKLPFSADKKYYTAPKLRRKSAVKNESIFTKDTPRKIPQKQFKPSTYKIDILSKSKNPVSPTIEKLKKKLEIDFKLNCGEILYEKPYNSEILSMEKDKSKDISKDVGGSMTTATKQNNKADYGNLICTSVDEKICEESMRYDLIHFDKDFVNDQNVINEEIVEHSEILYEPTLKIDSVHTITNTKEKELQGTEQISDVIELENILKGDPQEICKDMDKSEERDVNEKSTVKYETTPLFLEQPVHNQQPEVVLEESAENISGEIDIKLKGPENSLNSSIIGKEIKVEKSAKRIKSNENLKSLKVKNDNLNYVSPNSEVQVSSNADLPYNKQIKNSINQYEESVDDLDNVPLLERALKLVNLRGSIDKSEKKAKVRSNKKNRKSVPVDMVTKVQHDEKVREADTNLENKVLKEDETGKLSENVQNKGKFDEVVSNTGTSQHSKNKRSGDRQNSFVQRVSDINNFDKKMQKFDEELSEGIKETADKGNSANKNKSTSVEKLDCLEHKKEETMKADSAIKKKKQIIGVDEKLIKDNNLKNIKEDEESSKIRKEIKDTRKSSRDNSETPLKQTELTCASNTLDNDHQNIVDSHPISESDIKNDPLISASRGSGSNAKTITDSKRKEHYTKSSEKSSSDRHKKEKDRSRKYYHKSGSRSSSVSSHSSSKPTTPDSELSDKYEKTEQNKSKYRSGSVSSNSSIRATPDILDKERREHRHRDRSRSKHDHSKSTRSSSQISPSSVVTTTSTSGENTKRNSGDTKLVDPRSSSTSEKLSKSSKKTEIKVNVHQLDNVETGNKKSRENKIKSKKEERRKRGSSTNTEQSDMPSPTKRRKSGDSDIKATENATDGTIINSNRDVKTNLSKSKQTVGDSNIKGTKTATVDSKISSNKKSSKSKISKQPELSKTEEGTGSHVKATENASRGGKVSKSKIKQPELSKTQGSINNDVKVIEGTTDDSKISNDRRISKSEMKQPEMSKSEESEDSVIKATDNASGNSKTKGDRKISKSKTKQPELPKTEESANNDIKAVENATGDSKISNNKRISKSKVKQPELPNAEESIESVIKATKNATNDSEINSDRKLPKQKMEQPELFKTEESEGSDIKTTENATSNSKISTDRKILKPKKKQPELSKTEESKNSNIKTENATGDSEINSIKKISKSKMNQPKLSKTEENEDSEIKTTENVTGDSKISSDKRISEQKTNRSDLSKTEESIHSDTKATENSTSHSKISNREISQSKLTHPELSKTEKSEDSDNKATEHASSDSKISSDRRISQSKFKRPALTETKESRYSDTKISENTTSGSKISSDRRISKPRIKQPKLSNTEESEDSNIKATEIATDNPKICGDRKISKPGMKRLEMSNTEENPKLPTAEMRNNNKSIENENISIYHETVKKEVTQLVPDLKRAEDSQVLPMVEEPLLTREVEQDSESQKLEDSEINKQKKITKDETNSVSVEDTEANNKNVPIFKQTLETDKKIETSQGNLLSQSDNILSKVSEAALTDIIEHSNSKLLVGKVINDRNAVKAFETDLSQMKSIKQGNSLKKVTATTYLEDETKTPIKSESMNVEKVNEVSANELKQNSKYIMDSEVTQMNDVPLSNDELRSVLEAEHPREITKDITSVVSLNIDKLNEVEISKLKDNIEEIAKVKIIPVNTVSLIDDNLTKVSEEKRLEEPAVDLTHLGSLKTDINLKTPRENEINLGVTENNAKIDDFNASYDDLSKVLETTSTKVAKACTKVASLNFEESNNKIAEKKSIVEQNSEEIEGVNATHLTKNVSELRSVEEAAKDSTNSESRNESNVEKASKLKQTSEEIDKYKTVPTNPIRPDDDNLNKEVTHLDDVDFTNLTSLNIQVNESSTDRASKLQQSPEEIKEYKIRQTKQVCLNDDKLNKMSEVKRSEEIAVDFTNSESANSVANETKLKQNFEDIQKNQISEVTDVSVNDDIIQNLETNSLIETTNDNTKSELLNIDSNNYSEKMNSKLDQNQKNLTNLRLIHVEELNETTAEKHLCGLQENNLKTVADNAMLQVNDLNDVVLDCATKLIDTDSELANSHMPSKTVKLENEETMTQKDKLQGMKQISNDIKQNNDVTCIVAPSSSELENKATKDIPGQIVVQLPSEDSDSVNVPSKFIPNVKHKRVYGRQVKLKNIEDAFEQYLPTKSKENEETEKKTNRVLSITEVQNKPTSAITVSKCNDQPIIKKRKSDVLDLKHVSVTSENIPVSDMFNKKPRLEEINVSCESQSNNNKPAIQSSPSCISPKKKERKSIEVIITHLKEEKSGNSVSSEEDMRNELKSSSVDGVNVNKLRSKLLQKIRNIDQGPVPPIKDIPQSRRNSADESFKHIPENEEITKVVSDSSAFNILKSESDETHFIRDTSKSISDFPRESEPTVEVCGDRINYLNKKINTISGTTRVEYNIEIEEKSELSIPENDSGILVPTVENNLKSTTSKEINCNENSFLTAQPNAFINDSIPGKHDVTNLEKEEIIENSLNNVIESSFIDNSLQNVIGSLNSSADSLPRETLNLSDLIMHVDSTPTTVTDMEQITVPPEAVCMFPDIISTTISSSENKLPRSSSPEAIELFTFPVASEADIKKKFTPLNKISTKSGFLDDTNSTEKVGTLHESYVFSFSEQIDNSNAQTLSSAGIPLNLQDVPFSNIPIDSTQSLDLISQENLSMVQTSRNNNFTNDVPIGNDISNIMTEITCSNESDDQTCSNETDDHNYTLGGPLLSGRPEPEKKDITPTTNIIINNKPLDDSPNEFSLNDAQLQEFEFSDDTYKLNLDNEYAVKNLVILGSQSTTDTNAFPLTNYNMADIKRINLIDCSISNSEENINIREYLDSTISPSKQDAQNMSNDTNLWAEFIANENPNQRVVVLPNEQCLTITGHELIESITDNTAESGDKTVKDKRAIETTVPILPSPKTELPKTTISASMNKVNLRRNRKNIPAVPVQKDNTLTGFIRRYSRTVLRPDVKNAPTKSVKRPKKDVTVETTSIPQVGTSSMILNEMTPPLGEKLITATSTETSMLEDDTCLLELNKFIQATPEKILKESNDTASKAKPMIELIIPLYENKRISPLQSHLSPVRDILDKQSISKPNQTIPGLSKNLSDKGSFQQKSSERKKSPRSAPESLLQPTSSNTAKVTEVPSIAELVKSNKRTATNKYSNSYSPLASSTPKETNIKLTEAVKPTKSEPVDKPQLEDGVFSKIVPETRSKSDLYQPTQECKKASSQNNLQVQKSPVRGSLPNLTKPFADLEGKGKSLCQTRSSIQRNIQDTLDSTDNLSKSTDHLKYDLLSKKPVIPPTAPAEPPKIATSKYNHSVDSILSRDPKSYANNYKCESAVKDYRQSKNRGTKRGQSTLEDEREPGKVDNKKQRRPESNGASTSRDATFDELRQQGNVNRLISLVVTEDNKLKPEMRSSPLLAERRNSPLSKEKRGSPLPTERRNSPLSTERRNSPLSTERRNSPLSTERKNSPLLKSHNKEQNERDDRKLKPEARNSPLVTKSYSNKEQNEREGINLKLERSSPLVSKSYSKNKEHNQWDSNNSRSSVHPVFDRPGGTRRDKNEVQEKRPESRRLHSHYQPYPINRTSGRDSVIDMHRVHEGYSSDHILNRGRETRHSAYNRGREGHQSDYTRGREGLRSDHGRARESLPSNYGRGRAGLLSEHSRVRAQQSDRSRRTEGYQSDHTRTRGGQQFEYPSTSAQSSNTSQPSTSRSSNVSELYYLNSTGPQGNQNVDPSDVASYQTSGPYAKRNTRLSEEKMQQLVQSCQVKVLDPLRPLEERKDEGEYSWIDKFTERLPDSYLLGTNASAPQFFPKPSP